MGDEHALDCLCDLTLYTAEPGRTRAIERYARRLDAPDGTDERIVMDAKVAARFSLWRVERQHPIAGLILLDMIRDEEVWLMDNGLESAAPTGFCFASRVYTSGPFSMTCGVLVAIDAHVLSDIRAACTSLRGRSVDATVNHRKFATSLYRLDLDDSLTSESDWAA